MESAIAFAKLDERTRGEHGFSMYAADFNQLVVDAGDWSRTTPRHVWRRNDGQTRTYLLETPAAVRQCLNLHEAIDKTVSISVQGIVKYAGVGGETTCFFHSREMLDRSPLKDEFIDEIRKREGNMDNFRDYPELLATHLCNCCTFKSQIISTELTSVKIHVKY